MKTNILVESWKNFIKEQDELDPITLPTRIEPEIFTFGLVPMSAKPFHKGHMFLIKAASERCKKVIAYVSISDRSRKGEITIHGEDMQFIWESIITKYLPENVKCIYGGSPVSKVYEFLGDISEQGTSGGETYAIYTGQDDAKRYQDKYWSNIKDQVWVKEFLRGNDSPNISGTLMRSYLSNASQDKFLFLDGLPDMPDADKEEIFNILFRRLN